MLSTNEVHSTDKDITKQDILKQIIRLRFPYMLYHRYLNRETITGAVGDRGGGKSVYCAVWAFINFMLDDKPVWSNIQIKYGIKVSDEIAQEFTNGLLKTGGIVIYESLPLEKDLLLAIDETYRGGCIVIEEINVQYSNARKFMTNTNVNFNEFCQQLRKFQTSLAYNVIDEMFIDIQLRSLTDFFVKTYDTAFELKNMEIQKKTGVDFSWKIYPMSSYLAGQENKYAVTKRTLPPSLFNFEPWWGLFDTTKHQEKGIYSQSAKDKAKTQAEGSIVVPDDLKGEIDEWKWLEEKAQELADKGVEEITSGELWNYLGIYERGIHPAVIGAQLPRFGIFQPMGKQGRGKYLVRGRALA